MGLWWISFPDPAAAPDPVFMVIVRAKDMIGALFRAAELGAPRDNSNGFGGFIPRGVDLPEYWIDRVLTLAEMAQLKAVMADNANI